MTPERWKRIKQIAGQAWDEPPARRETRAWELCGSDEALHVDVIELLRAMASAAHVLEPPPWPPKAGRRGRPVKPHSRES